MAAHSKSDKIAKDVNPELSDFLKSEFGQCSMCKGYYGHNFGQPVCSTCHIFLFSNDVNQSDEVASRPEKADSGDSGNEEPVGEGDFYMRIEESYQQGRFRPDMLAERGNVDKLTERVALLSGPRDYSMDNIPSGLFDTLPPEVMVAVFRYLDDISLFNAGQVCTRWHHILNAESSQEEWETYVYQRWPLYRPQFKVQNWKMVYTKLMQSAPCLYCLDNMMLQSSLPIEENSWRHRRLRSELKTLKSDPPEGIQATPLDRHCCHWQASITGPQGSPYEGGLLLLYLQIPSSYPMRPPVVRFITKVFHPNISRHGDVGLDSIHHNWSLALTISKVLVSVQSLLTDPYCSVCMEPAIARLYTNSREEFNRIARLWTWKYAMQDFLPPCNVPLDGI